MTTVETLLLEALKAALEQRTVGWEQVSPEDWHALFRLAEIHHILPMVLQAVRRCPAGEAAPAEIWETPRKRAMRLVLMQTQRAHEFRRIYAALENAGVRALVVKGAICRALYPLPDQRVSGDEDLLVHPEDLELAVGVLAQCGLQAAVPEEDFSKSYEISFTSPSMLIEVHASLFSRDEAGLNALFDKAFDRAVQAPALPFRTLCPADHLLYLILHAFKHFLYSGFGIRQVSDICLFAAANSSEISWDSVLQSCRRVRAEKFAAAIFTIGQQYLTFDPDKAGLTGPWLAMHPDPTHMLEDLLRGGIYGSSSEARVHSSNITISAFRQKQADAPRRSKLLRTVFPPIQSMQASFPYLQERPYLLPLAWGTRIARYAAGSGAKGAAESLRIGSERLALLKEYDII